MDEKRAYGKQTSGSFRKRPRDQFDNGKRKKHNPNYDHGSTNKPIDTIYRILCPVKKIGSVLGKGGDIVNALRDETHAKIRVADAIPGAEERVIIIFNYQSESEKNNPGQDTENSDESELEKNMLPHCPAQDALLKIHDRIAADEILRGGVVQERTEPDDIVTARILVPKNQVGCLLGKGGNIIKQLRTDSGANIRILPPDHLPPCAMGSDELVQVSGVPSITKKALFRISTLLHQHPNKENPPLEDIIYASTQGSYRSDSSLPPPFPQGNRVWSPYYSDARDQPTISRFSRYPDEPLRYPPGSFSRNNYQEAETAEEFSIRILCATVKIGGVIGKGGTNIRQLEQQTGARIQVEDMAPDAEERVINISCKEVPWETRSPTIEAVLQLQSRTSTNSDDGAITTRLLVPSSKVGCILGQGGDIITEMRRRTRADIRVYSKDDKPKYASANEELVQISGPTEFARDALAEIASRLRARTFRSGNSSVSPASAPAASFRGVPPFERISHRGVPSAGNADTGSTQPGHFRGYNPERFPDRGISSSSMFGPEKSVGYDYPKAYRQSYEAQYFHSSNAAGYTNNAPAESKIPYGGATSVGSADISNSEIRQGQQRVGYPQLFATHTFQTHTPSHDTNSITSRLPGAFAQTPAPSQVPGARVKSHDPMSGAPAHVIDGHGPSEYSRRGPGHFPPPYMPSGSQSIPPSQQSIRPY